MTYDVPFRHMQAIDPSSLTTITATLHALNRAMEDCRIAGVDLNEIALPALEPSAPVKVELALRRRSAIG